MECVYVRFDKSLDYKTIVNSRDVKKFVGNAIDGEYPQMVSPTMFTFDRDKLRDYVQNEYNLSEDYLVDRQYLNAQLVVDYLHAHGYTNHSVSLIEFEPDCLLDDHIVTVNDGDTVLGVFATRDDFAQLIDYLDN